ncbi:MAG: hypothetical protein AAGI25_10170 [Bacteroidota bacterium]
MSSFKIRPRFKHFFHGKKERLEKKILEGLDKSDGLIYNYLPGHVYIKIHPKNQHFWSPQLHLSFEEEKEDQVIVRGLYGPNPTVWAIFFFGYVALGILILFLGMWGLTRYSLGMDHTILWFIPVLILMAMVLYFFAQTGQKLGAQQMFEIHHFYEELTDNRINVE